VTQPCLITVLLQTLARGFVLCYGFVATSQRDPPSAFTSVARHQLGSLAPLSQSLSLLQGLPEVPAFLSFTTPRPSQACRILAFSPTHGPAERQLKNYSRVVRSTPLFSLKRKQIFQRHRFIRQAGLYSRAPGVDTVQGEDQLCSINNGY
jgi:hypothetical protein